MDLRPSRRRWLLTVLAAAVGAIVVLSIHESDDRVQIPANGTNPRPGAASAPAAAPAQATGSVPLAAPHERGSSAIEPPLASAPQVPIASERSIDLVVTAPIQAVHGSTFEVSVGIPAGSAAQSGTFHVRYEPESLEVLDIIDATGTKLMVIPSGSDTIDFDFDIRQGAIRVPAIEFLARTDRPHLVYISASAELWDAAGRALATSPAAPYPIMLVP